MPNNLTYFMSIRIGVRISTPELLYTNECSSLVL